MLTLYGFFRSSAAWRVRIALALKGLAYEAKFCDLRTGEQRSAEYLALNAQGLVPALKTADAVLTQSLPIIEYLDEVYPAPALLPGSPLERARVRALAAVIACDVHPLNNLRVLEYLKRNLAADQDQVGAWYRHWIDEAFLGLEAQVRVDSGGRFCFGDRVSLADVCLVPQLYNARRFAVDLTPYPKLQSIDAHLLTLPAFRDTAPEKQVDAA